MADAPSPQPTDSAYVTEDPPPRAGRSLRSKPLLLGAAAVLAVMLTAGVLVTRGGSSAATTGGAPAATTVPASGSGGAAKGGRSSTRPGTAGVIASKSGSSLTVTTANGQTVEVATTGSTVVTRTVSIDLSAIHVGDHVIARGTTTGSTVAATGVTDLGANVPSGTGSGSGRGGNGAPAGSSGSTPPNAPANVGTQGTVTAVSPSGLTMTDAGGADVVVTTNGSTTFSATAPSTVDSLVVGEQIQVTGSTGADGTVTATAIRVGGAGFGGNGGRGSGAPNNNSPGA